MEKTPEAIQKDFPHLSLADIYAAFAYYCDHQEQIDADIEEDERVSEELRIKYATSISSDEPLDRFRHRSPSKPTF